MEAGRLSLLTAPINISELSHTPVHIIGKWLDVAHSELLKPLKTVGLRAFRWFLRRKTAYGAFYSLPLYGKDPPVAPKI